MPKDPSPYLTQHGAQLLAARLQRRGMPYTGGEVMRWHRHTVRAARLWLDLELDRQRWRDFMGDDLPKPPLHQPWGAGADRTDAPATITRPPQSPPMR